MENHHGSRPEGSSDIVQFAASPSAPFEDDRGHSARLSVAKTDPNLFYPAFASHLFRPTAQDDKRFATLFFLHVEIAPTHRFSNPGPERLRKRLLRRETRRQMAGREFHRLRIGDLALRKNTLQKAIAIFGASFFLRPISLILIALIVASIGFYMWRQRHPNKVSVPSHA